MDLPIILRSAQASDHAYIMASWLRECHKVVPTCHIPNSIYFPHQAARITKLLGQSEVTIACIDDEPDQIVGYLVARPYDASNLLVHWAATKAIYRRLGVLKALLEPYQVQDKNLVCSHYFKLFRELKERWHLVYDPTILEAV